MELIFQDYYERMQCRIYAREQSGSKIIMIGYDGENLIEQTLPDTPEIIDIKPLLIIPIFMKDALIKAFISEGAKSNLRTENENLLKGKLEATELHLKDMREFSQKLLNNKLLVKIKSNDKENKI
ncbi:MAG: hypothetical protein M0P71_12050 [Melioribacteraceae bacterium]|jgi:hypothetical protein|nr:hypothetical protein [Melioribacteraceae bacterium]